MNNFQGFFFIFFLFQLSEQKDWLLVIVDNFSKKKNHISLKAPKRIQLQLHSAYSTSTHFIIIRT